MDENRVDENELVEHDDDQPSAWEQLKAYSSTVILLGLVGVMAALVSFAWLGELNIVGQLLLVIGLILVILYIALEPQIVQRAATARQTRYGLNALVMSLAFVGIVFLVNVALYKYNTRHDYTAGQDYTISQQTVKILENLDQEIRVTVFIREMDGRRDKLEDLLKEYTRRTDKLRYEFVDPDVRPGLTNQYAITRYGTLVFESEGRRQDTFGATEQDITSAIIKVTRGEAKRVYFLTGHKEPGLDDAANTGYSKAKTALESNNYEAIELNLVVSGTIPADATAVVLAAPKNPLGEKEAPALLDYLRNGGKLLLLVDQGQTTGLEEGLQQEYGVALENDVIIDPGSSIQGEPLMPVMQRYTWSQITKDLGLTFFPWSRSITQTTPSPEGVVVQVLCQTSDQSWGETDFSDPNPKYDEGADIKGPLNLCLTVEKTASPVGGGGAARLVLIGNSSFATNVIFDQQSNGDLFVSCVNWLAEDEDLITIRPKPPVVNRLDLLPHHVPPIIFSSVCLLPLLILGVGALVWWRRR